jgi:hypothetical protein
MCTIKSEAIANYTSAERGSDNEPIGEFEDATIHLTAPHLNTYGTSPFL